MAGIIHANHYMGFSGICERAEFTTAYAYCNNLSQDVSRVAFGRCACAMVFPLAADPCLLDFRSSTAIFETKMQRSSDMFAIMRMARFW